MALYSIVSISISLVRHSNDAFHHQSPRLALVAISISISNTIIVIVVVL
jgi:hypothetical protein